MSDAISSLMESGVLGLVLAAFILSTLAGGRWLAGRINWALERLMGNSEHQGLIPQIVKQHQDFVKATMDSSQRHDSLFEQLLSLNQHHTQLLNQLCQRFDENNQSLQKKDDQISKLVEQSNQLTKSLSHLLQQDDAQ